MKSLNLMFQVRKMDRHVLQIERCKKEIGNHDSQKYRHARAEKIGISTDFLWSN